MALKILPYKLGSQSAKALAKALGVKRLIPGGGYRPKQFVNILNWGNSGAFTHGRMLNNGEAIRNASNKLAAFRLFKDAGLPTPEFTTSKDEATKWQRKGFRVVCRTLLNSHSGRGIVIAQPDEDIPYAPLYTKYTKKDKEFRIHVFKGRVIDVCEKRRKSGTEGSSLIRTLNNGWVYCREGVYFSDANKQLAIRAVQTLGLDFGAVDLIMKDERVFILEVNSAPGLQGTTLNRYVEALRQYV